MSYFVFAVCLKPVPYSDMIPGGMFPKRTIVIRGMVPYGGDRCVFVTMHAYSYNMWVLPDIYSASGSVCCRMSINFLVSRSRDIAFHLNPRVKEGIVIRNSMIGGNWGQEERELSMNPFMEGQYFDVSSICHKQTLYLVYIAFWYFYVIQGHDFDPQWVSSVLIFPFLSLRCRFAVGTEGLRCLWMGSTCLTSSTAFSHAMRLTCWR